MLRGLDPNRPKNEEYFYLFEPDRGDPEYNSDLVFNGGYVVFSCPVYMDVDEAHYGTLKHSTMDHIFKAFGIYLNLGRDSWRPGTYASAKSPTGPHINPFMFLPSVSNAISKSII